MAHALERTSAKGESFVGTCIKCGKPNLVPADIMAERCPKTRLYSDEKALLKMIE